MDWLREGIFTIVDALDRGEPIEGHIRESVKSLPPAERESILTILEVALEIHRAPVMKEAAQPTPAVKNPRYRKGTGRRPVSWSDCLWKPGTTYQ